MKFEGTLNAEVKKQGENVREFLGGQLDQLIQDGEVYEVSDAVRTIIEIDLPGAKLGKILEDPKEYAENVCNKHELDGDDAQAVKQLIGRLSNSLKYGDLKTLLEDDDGSESTLEDVGTGEDLLSPDGGDESVATAEDETGIEPVAAANEDSSFERNSSEELERELGTDDVAAMAEEVESLEKELADFGQSDEPETGAGTVVEGREAGPLPVQEALERFDSEAFTGHITEWFASLQQARGDLESNSPLTPEQRQAFIDQFVSILEAHAVEAEESPGYPRSGIPIQEPNGTARIQSLESYRSNLMTAAESPDDLRGNTFTIIIPPLPGFRQRHRQEMADALFT